MAYFSTKHIAQEYNYDIYDKELLGVIKALEEWRPELEGAQQQFEIITDHKNLQTFATSKELNQRQIRWAEFLLRFNFRLVYRPGSVNTRADALSRRPQDSPHDLNDDRLRARRIPLIPASKFHHSYPMLRSLRLFGLDISRPIEDLITEAYQASPVTAMMLEDLQQQDARRWRPQLKKELRILFAECRVVVGRVYFRDRLVIPPDDENIQL